MEIRVVGDPAGACVKLLIDAARADGQIVAAGGSTPRTCYQQATSHPEVWGGAALWFGDERCVPPDDERSNYLMVKHALLDPLPESSRPAVHRIRGELGPHEAADEYERLLEDAGRPRFDLVLLGLGPDGHTASLFPNQPTLSEHSRWVVGVEQAGLEPFVPRVTLTFTALAAAKQIVFLVSGAAKADSVAAAFGSNAKPDPQVPASLLPTLIDSVTVLLDPPAAGKL